MPAFCTPCRPTYRKHVDAIFPKVAKDGLVKSKMDSLAYYAMTSPEKLDRIGEYLADRISHDAYRGRKELVNIGVEAMDQLLQSACHVRNLNLFVESFLITIQKLLESPDSDFKILASASFLHFSKLEEDIPNYHRSYDFSINQFSEMCLVDNMEEMNKQLRLSGLDGLYGVIRKTINEDLAENIWEAKHMDKIINSLIFNLTVNDINENGKKSGDEEIIYEKTNIIEGNQLLPHKIMKDPQCSYYPDPTIFDIHIAVFYSIKTTFE